MDEQIMKLVPKSKHPGIRDAYEDSEGLWLHLKDGWTSDSGHIIHARGRFGVALLAESIRKIN